MLNSGIISFCSWRVYPNLVYLDQGTQKIQHIHTLWGTSHDKAVCIYYRYRYT